MTHDLEPLRQRAHLLARLFAFALAYLAHPGLGRLRRALVRLEDQFRGWLLYMNHIAPEGLFGADPQPRKKPARAPVPPPPSDARRPPSSHFKLGLAYARNPPLTPPKPKWLRAPANERAQLIALNLRINALVIALKDPSRLLVRLGRILATRPLARVLPVPAAFSQPPASYSHTGHQTLHAPEPHKRE